jgi:hypothetical protein
MSWSVLRKRGTLLHIKYGLTFSNNLYGYRVSVRTEPSLEMLIDLNPNLRTRIKSTNSYYDASELAEGEIMWPTVVQLTDEHIINRLRSILSSISTIPNEWVLTVELNGYHDFRIRPELSTRSGSLFLRVV